MVVWLQATVFVWLPLNHEPFVVVCRGLPLYHFGVGDADGKVNGSKFYTLISLKLKGISGINNQFKSGLGKWLSSIPAQPTVSRKQRATKTNSLLNQLPLYQNTL